jgi:hypothetical protein
VFFVCCVVGALSEDLFVRTSYIIDVAATVRTTEMEGNRERESHLSRL